jgi:hypothetical protein
MADEENVNGADENQTDDTNSAESTDSQGLTEEQVENLLRERDKKWQSKFDKLLQEKKETETKSKTAEERIAEIERKYEQERLGRVRERAISGAKLDSDVVDAAKALLSSDEESVGNGAAKLAELLNTRAESIAQERIEEEISRRFPKDKGKPQGGKSDSGLLSLEELQQKSQDPKWVEENEDLINKSLESMRG